MSTEPYPEHDKLGPLAAPPPTHAFDEGADLRASIVAAFRAAIDDAGRAAADPSAEEAVHGLRKALRRARAIKRLVRARLPKAERREITRALVDARRTLSATRDLAVVPGALGTVGVDDAAREHATQVLAGAHAAALPEDEVRRLVDDVLVRVRPLADAMDAALPPTLDWADLEDGVAETYRVARRALRRRSRRAFHAFRKRAKELTYQLELFADGIDGRTEARRAELADLGDELGGVVDVVMLRGVLERHGGRADLLDQVDDDLDRRIKAARRRARELFDRRPRQFARKVVRAVRRDHARPASPVAQA